MWRRGLNRSFQLSTRSAGGYFRNFSAHAQEKPFDKILIANRGEIACRIIRTCKRLGVKTVAVYSEADASSMFVRMADEAYCIGPAASKDSYLRGDRILEICKKTGAQGIHPGYGFLSENAKFVDEVERNGIVFIGPSSAPMNAMGDKINSKKIAKDAGCFVIPGFEGEVENEEEAVRLAKEVVGYPVMIKASAGGGGKGMRVAYNDDEVREGFRLSKAEALSSFGDDRMLIERFIENPHHIEIQVLADTHGNVVAFPERECSIQRRNQKVVEESPSVYIKPETRKAMQEQAILLCKATKYRSAGTVEMLADDKQNFYFLEMNTRLQVEHPITELVSGEDLVEHMLWVGAGKKLPDRLTKNPCLGYNGSAIESRVYAEDPTRNFLPSIGPLISYREPETFATDNGTVRIDTGVYEGGVISMHYDPMIAKLCTWAPQRKDSIKLMERALDQYVVQGLGNNITFLRSVMRNKNFRDGNYCTKFIGEEYPKGFKRVALNDKETHELLASAALFHTLRTDAVHPEEFVEEGAEFVMILNAKLPVGGDVYHCRVAPGEEGDLTFHIVNAHTKESHTVHINQANWLNESPLAVIEFGAGEGNSKTEYVQYLGRPHGPGDDALVVRYRGGEHGVIIRTPQEHELAKHLLPPEHKDMSKALLSPMPGTLISCSVKVGQHVEAGQQLAIVEAMKMQNVLRAERKGVVKAVKKHAGQALKVDEVIIEFE